MYIHSAYCALGRDSDYLCPGARLTRTHVTITLAPNTSDYLSTLECQGGSGPGGYNYTPLPREAVPYAWWRYIFVYVPI